jgi:hypothetical protein
VLGKRSGLVVVDVDPQNNGSLQAVLDRYGWDKMKTRTVAAPSGGHHLDYSYPNGEERGGYELKGVPGEWHLFAVASP